MKFKKGDIVRDKRSNKGFRNLYIIVDLLLDKDEFDGTVVDTVYDVIKIYPIDSRVDKLISIEEGDVSILAKNGSNEKRVVIESIKTERKAYNLDIPKYLLHVDYDEIDKEVKNVNNEENIEVKQKVKVKTKKFNDKNIIKILADETTKKQMDIYVEKMNLHLDLLNTALNNNNDKEISFQKEQLEKVRQKLMELEYFKLNNRR